MMVPKEKGLFPELLHQLLEAVGKNDESDIVSWSDNDMCFKVHQKDIFLEKILPRYFRLSQYKSFIRQLNLWGFTCIGEGKYKGYYQHSRFVQHQVELTADMFREKNTGSKNSRGRKRSDSHLPETSSEPSIKLQRFDAAARSRALSSADTCSPTTTAVPPAATLPPSQPSLVPLSQSLNVALDFKNSGTFPHSALLQSSGLVMEPQARMRLTREEQQAYSSNLHQEQHDHQEQYQQHQIHPNNPQALGQDWFSSLEANFCVYGALLAAGSNATSSSKTTASAEEDLLEPRPFHSGDFDP